MNCQLSYNLLNTYVLIVRVTPASFLYDTQVIIYPR